MIRRFVAWDVLPRLRARAERKPLNTASRRRFGDQINQATLFLGWLARANLRLGDCGQADIDAWYVEHRASAHTNLRSFLRWCGANRLTRRFRLPTR